MRLYLRKELWEIPKLICGNDHRLQPGEQCNLFTHILVHLMQNAFGGWLLCCISFSYLSILG